MNTVKMQRLRDCHGFFVRGWSSKQIAKRLGWNKRVVEDLRRIYNMPGIKEILAEEAEREIVLFDEIESYLRGILKLHIRQSDEFIYRVTKREAIRLGYPAPKRIAVRENTKRIRNEITQPTISEISTEMEQQTPLGFPSTI